MIEKLRKKLIVVAMGSLLSVLIILTGGVMFASYHSIVTQADRTLSLLQENDGYFPENMLHGMHQGSAELPFETRFFTVVMSQDGTALFTNTGKIAAVNSEQAIEYGQKIYASSNTKGFLNQYRFIRYEKDDQVWVIFMDCGRDLSSFRNTFTIMVALCVVGVVIVFVLLLILSARIMKPFVENEARQKRFVTDAGHELKTPLTIIDADTQILEMDYGENEWLQDISTQTKRLANLTNELIYLSKMEEGRQESAMIDFPFSDVVQESVDSFAALALTQKKELSASIEPMITMKGDENALGRLVTIFLDNAMKYTPEEGKISVVLSVKKSSIVLEVENTSESISQENIDHLFDRFYRSDASRNSATGGYGLGLSIASAIVHTHKGKIAASSKDGKSLCITVTFPTHGKK